MSDESINASANQINCLNFKLDYFNNPKFWVEFNERFLKTYTAGFNQKIINLYIMKWNGSHFILTMVLH